KEHVSVYIVKKEYFEKFIKDIHNLEKILNKRLEENSEELKKDLESAYIKYLRKKEYKQRITSKTPPTSF
ncbi:MAG: hypothetical protein KAJ24_02045, partial [Candidatus Aenigmarchaeota archaeon]|nr:hypothetical protein [Candidatus Aenigmarchaeota archaeon]